MAIDRLVGGASRVVRLRWQSGRIRRHPADDVALAYRQVAQTMRCPWSASIPIGRWSTR